MLVERPIISGTRGWIALVAILWMVVSIVLIAYFTAAVTTEMTVKSLAGDISQRPRGDLNGYPSEQFIPNRKVTERFGSATPVGRRRGG